MASQYHRILGVPENASKEEIKKAYRAKARKYHPDVSTHPNAKELFLRVTEAYNGLMEGRTGPVRKKVRRKAEKPKEQTPKKHRNDRYKPAEDPAARHRERQEKLRRDGVAFYKKYKVSTKYKVTGIIAFASIALGLFLVVNYYLPYTSEKQIVAKKFYVNTSSRGDQNSHYFFELQRGDTVQVNLQLYNFVAPGDALVYSRTRLIPLVANIQRIHEGFREDKPSSNMLFSWFYFIVLLLLYPVIRFKLDRPHVSFYFVDFSIRTGIVALILLVLIQFFTIG